MPIKLLSTDQLREADRYTIRHEPIASIELMERAAGKCTNWILENYNTDSSLYMFCGTGNNGGDGLAIARLLKASGFSTVNVYIVGTPEKGSPDFLLNLDRLKGLGNTPYILTEQTDFPDIPSGAVIVDALFGTGLSRPVEGIHLEFIQLINELNREVISIDLPSGMFGEDNSSNSLAGIIQATHTLTFQQPKLSFLFPDAGEKAGSWHIMDIGLSSEFIEGSPSSFFLTIREDIERLEPKRKKFSHKGTYGHCLLAVGSKGMMGAAVLATRSALRSGVGLVTAMVPGCGYSILQTTAPEAMCFACSSENNISGSIDWHSYDSIGIGPGIGKNPMALATLSDLLSNYKGLKVIDADALNLIAENRELLKLLNNQTVLTPHPGEFDRLFGKSTSAYKRLIILQQKAKELGCYIVLKGAHSAIATPQGDIHFNNTGNPGMAKGGSGDVLTGYLTGLMAALKDPLSTSLLAVWKHGETGDLVARDLGMENMTALDVAKLLT